jgi:branched-chain amino acid transport system substrate-binding protein
VRRSIVAALAVTVFTCLVTWLGLVRADAQTPIRVGFMTTKTGPLAAIGLQMETGLLQFLKERNYLLAGRKVELYTVDTAATPAVANPSCRN